VYIHAFFLQEDLVCIVNLGPACPHNSMCLRSVCVLLIMAMQVNQLGRKFESQFFLNTQSVCACMYLVQAHLCVCVSCGKFSMYLNTHICVCVLMCNSCRWNVFVRVQVRHSICYSTDHTVFDLNRLR